MIQKDELTNPIPVTTLSLCTAVDAAHQCLTHSHHGVQQGNAMRTHEISSPNAAELYFNNSIYGQIYMLVAEALGRAERRRDSAEPRPQPRPLKQPARAVAEAAPRTGFLDRLDAWFWRQAQREQEAYLAKSRDVFDLERRIRALERGEITPYY